LYEFWWIEIFGNVQARLNHVIVVVCDSVIEKVRGGRFSERPAGESENAG
jgi:hypothetical protein